MRARDARRGALLALVVMLVVAAGGVGYLVARHVHVRDVHNSEPSLPANPAVLGSAGGAPTTQPAPAAAPVPVAARVAAALAADVRNPALGARLRASVVDGTTGSTLYNHAGTTPAAPASTAKLLAAAAVLDVRAPTSRITTTVRAGPLGTGSIVLVGGGDPTLSGAAPGEATAYPGAARLSDLAAQLRRSHVAVHSIVVDDSLFTGQTVSPAWAPEDVPSDYESGVTAVMADGGRALPTNGIRSASPDLAAGHELARLLGTPDLPVTRGHAAASARPLASVQSAQLSDLVEQMLQESDNVIAECLARLVAVSRGIPASFTGAAHAIRAVLRTLGVDVGGGMKDGSGLAASDRVSPQSLARVLRLIVSPAHPRLHAIVAALPVAGWSGTLQDRYLAGTSTAAAAGDVRAKTGTLTGVSSLAGIVHDADGRLVVFALIADRVAPGSTPTAAAEAVLDVIATRLAGCGCR